jgi:nitroreductase
MQRRSFLKGMGVVSVAVLGGAVWRAHDQGVFSSGEGPAYEPWKNWRTASGNGPLALVRAAILAASPHNTQPWLFKVSPSAIELHLDPRRNVGALDPYLREEYIGMGCALENLLLAASVAGYATSVKLLPGKPVSKSSGSGPVAVARVDLAPEKQEENELYDAIPRRHTNRTRFEPQKPLPPGALDKLARLTMDEANVKMFLFAAEADRKKIAQLSSEANVAVYSDPQVERDSNQWIRTRWASVQKYRDGLTVDAFGLPPLATAIAKMMPPAILERAASHRPQNEYFDLMMSAPLIGIVAVRDRYDREDCLRAGRIWQRAHLLATARGFAGRPCNEAVEAVDHEKALGKSAAYATTLGEIVGDSTWQPTFIFYMGYPTWPARPSPRRPIESVVLE